jgi:transposase InsO family protein
VVDPLPTKSLGGAYYFITFTDDFSQKTWIYLRSEKDQTLSKYKLFKVMIEKLMGVSIKTIRTNGGGEYISREFIGFCLDAGILREKTATYSAFQNGLAERRNQSILEETGSMMLEAGLPSFLWAELAKTSVYLLNRSPTKPNSGHTPKEFFLKKFPTCDTILQLGD